MKKENVYKLPKLNNSIACSSSGQALVENVLIIPIIVVIVVMLFWFAEIMLTKQQLVMATRYGTDLILYSNMSKDQIKAEITDYLCGINAAGRRLDPSKLVIKDDGIIINKPDQCNPINMWNSIDYSPSAASCVEIYYKFDSPKLFSAWDSYIGGGNIIKKLRIGARSEVLAGTGCQGEN